MQSAVGSIIILALREGLQQYETVLSLDVKIGHDGNNYNSKSLTVFSRKTVPSFSQKASRGVSHLVGNTTPYIFIRERLEKAVEAFFRLPTSPGFQGPYFYGEADI